MKKLILVSFALVLCLICNGQNIVHCNKINFDHGIKTMESQSNLARLVLKYEDDIIFKKHFSFHLEVECIGRNFILDPNKIVVKYQPNENKNKLKITRVFSKVEWKQKKLSNVFWFGPDDYKTVGEATTTTTDRGNSTISTTVSPSISATTNIQSSNTTESSTAIRVYTGEKEKAFEEARKDVEDNYLKKHSMVKGSTMSGIVAIDMPKAFGVLLEVPIGNEIFKFDLSQELVQ